MAKLIRKQRVAADNWQRLELSADGALPAVPAEGNVIVPLKVWQQRHDALAVLRGHQREGGAVGVRAVEGGVEAAVLLAGQRAIERRLLEDDADPLSYLCLLGRQVRPGDLFVAVSDADGDGHDAVFEAVQRGASAVLAERLLPDIPALRPHHLSIYMGYSWLPAKDVLKSLDLFGAHVLPRLRHAGAAL